MKVEKTSYLKIPIDWLFSIYIVFLVAVLARYVWLAVAPGARRGSRPAPTRRTRVPACEPHEPVLAGGLHDRRRCRLLGLPIGHAMIGGSILYLWLAGLDIGTAAEQLLNGMYTSYVLLAVPLFILAAEFMNSGSIMDRLLRFCNALVGRYRGGLAQVNVAAEHHLRGMSGSALADAAGSGKLMQTLMTKDGKYTPSFAAALSAASSVIGPIIPPSIPLVLYALVSDTSIGYLFLGGVVPGPAARRRADAPDRLHRAPAQLPGRAAGAAARPAAHHLGGVPGAADAGHPARPASTAASRRRPRPRPSRRAYALLASALIYRSVTLRDVYRVAAVERARHDLDRHADRRRAGVQLRDHGREHPEDARRAAQGLRALAARLPAARRTCCCSCSAASSRARRSCSSSCRCCCRPPRRWASTRCTSAWSRWSTS